MKREDAAIIIRAVLIGLFCIAVIAAGCVLAVFILHAQMVNREVMS